MPEVDAHGVEVKAPSPNQGWRDQYLTGSDLYDNETLKTINDIPSLAKMAVETKSLVGRKGVIIPKEGAAPEEWEHYYAALGRPATPEAYQLEVPREFPQGFPYDPEMEKTYKAAAHQAGLTPVQANALYKASLEANAAKYQQQVEELKTSMQDFKEKLTSKWGDKYEENFALAQKTQQRLAPQGSTQLAALDRAMGEDPFIIEFFYNLGRQMSEADFVSGGSQVSQSLDEKRQSLMSSKAYTDDKHPDHKRVVDEVTKIYQKLHPEAA